MCFIQGDTTQADTSTYRFTWSYGTIIDISVYIESSDLEDGSHDMAITVTLVDLNSQAVDIHDLYVEYRIPVGLF